MVVLCREMVTAAGDSFTCWLFILEILPSLANSCSQIVSSLWCWLPRETDVDMLLGFSVSRCGVPVVEQEFSLYLATVFYVSNQLVFQCSETKKSQKSSLESSNDLTCFPGSRQQLSVLWFCPYNGPN